MEERLKSKWNRPFTFSQQQVTQISHVSDITRLINSIDRSFIGHTNIHSSIGLSFVEQNFGKKDSESRTDYEFSDNRSNTIPMLIK